MKRKMLHSCFPACLPRRRVPNLPALVQPGAQAQWRRSARLGSYLTVTGNIVAHQRQNYFTFRDGTGETRVEIDNSVWQNRQIAPDTKVRLLTEVNQGVAGRYRSVKSPEVVK